MTQLVEELEALIKDYRWEHFEADPLGQLQVGSRLFCMRVGIHMNRPVQAIIADGQFVRMRSAEFYEDKKLHKIDPERLSECLYMDGAQAGNSWPKWRPLLQDQAKLIGAQQQAANQAYSQKPGGGGLITSSEIAGGRGGSGGSMAAELKMQQIKVQYELEKVMLNLRRASAEPKKSKWW